MKTYLRTMILILALMFGGALVSGCFVAVEEDHDGGGGGGGGGHDHDDALIEQWYPINPSNNLLWVGGDCSGWDAAAGCTWLDEDWSTDTIELTSFDSNLIDLQFNYVLTNWGDEPTFVWIMLCDDLGCEDVIEVELWPGEEIFERVVNPVLDTALWDYYDCLDYWGGECWMYYDLEVVLGQDCTCSDVTLDYYYDGLYQY